MGHFTSMILPTLLLSAVVVTAASSAKTSSSSKRHEYYDGVSFMKSMNAKQQEQKQRRDNELGFGVCDTWPISERSLPNGMDILNITDGTAPLCGSMSQLLFDTSAFLDTVQGEKTLTNAQVSPSTLLMNCDDYPPATILSVVRLSQFNRAYELIRDCYTARNPIVTFRLPPKEGAHIELATKDGIDRLIKKYNVCGVTEEDCLIPQTFRISTDLEECQTFFFNAYTDDAMTIPNAAFQNRGWIMKPTNGYAGRDVRRIRDFDTDLQAYRNCDNIGSQAEPIVVQAELKPYLVDGHACHIRTFFLFKFGSELLVDQRAGIAYFEDPPQAWHIDAGNIHTCVEKYEDVGDGTLQSFAVACNKPWTKHPNRTQIDISQFMPMPYPLAFQQNFDVQTYYMIMGHISHLFRKLALLFLEHSVATETYSKDNEAMWTTVGVDIALDENMKPWLLDINPCHKKPFVAKNQPFDASWNPYVSILRIVMSHYKRMLMGDDYFHEDDCTVLDESEQKARVHNVF